MANYDLYPANKWTKPMQGLFVLFALATLTLGALSIAFNQPFNGWFLMCFGLAGVTALVTRHPTVTGLFGALALAVMWWVWIYPFVDNHSSGAWFVILECVTGLIMLFIGFVLGRNVMRRPTPITA